MRMRSLALRVVRGIALAYVLACVVACVSIDSLMFHPELVRGRYTASLPGFVDIGKDGERIAAWYGGGKDSRKAVLYCHGNAEDITSSMQYFKEFVKRGWTVLAVDWPGFGLSSGKPTEEGCYRTVHRAYEYLVKERGFAAEDVFVLGFSIGTGPATELASTEKIGGLILEAPFLSAPRIVTGVRILPMDPFPNIARIDKIGCPLLVIHGTDDSIVPFRHGEMLFEKAKEPKRHVPVEGADHTDFIAKMGLEAYIELMEDFMRGAGGNGLN